MVDKLNDERQRLFQSLNEEEKLIQQFVELLSVEQSALSAGKTDDLSGISERKSGLAVELERLAEVRNNALSAAGLPTDSEGMAAWCAQFPDEQAVTNLWTRILDLAREARELNRLNGDLIQLRMNATASALESLRAGKTSLDLYGPDGQSARNEQRRIDHAV